MIQKIICLSAVLIIASCTLHNGSVTQVLSANRVVDVKDPSAKVCESFHLTKSEIMSFYQVAEQVSNEEEHGESFILPCKYEGKITMNNKTYSYEIFAGGSGYIYDKKGWVVKNLICRSSTCCNELSGLC
jgi:hypothetical protein